MSNITILQNLINNHFIQIENLTQTPIPKQPQTQTQTPIPKQPQTQTPIPKQPQTQTPIPKQPQTQPQTPIPKQPQTQPQTQTQNTILQKCKRYKCHDYMKNKSILPELPEPPKHIKKLAKYEVRTNAGGLTNIGVTLKKFPEARIGTMVAGNSGRPGGACGQINGTAKNLNANHTTQEEDVISNWLITATNKANEKIINEQSLVGNLLFAKTIYKGWGMTNPGGNDFNTIQGIDYTKAQSYEYADAWVVQNVELSNKVMINNNNEYDTNNSYLTTLVFVAGPNCGSKGKGPSSSMTRTFNNTMVNNYDRFKEGVEATLFAGLYAMAMNGCTIALIAAVSTGIYASTQKGDANDKKRQKNIRKDFESIVNKVLERECLTQKTRNKVRLGDYFDKVILTKL